MKTLNREEAAKFLRISAYTLRELAVKGEIPGAMIGGRWIFVQEVLEQHLLDAIEKQKTAAKGAPAESLTPDPAPPIRERKMRRRPCPPPSLAM